MIAWLCAGIVAGLLIVIVHEIVLDSRRNRAARAQARWDAEIARVIRITGGNP